MHLKLSERYLSLGRQSNDLVVDRGAFVEVLEIDALLSALINAVCSAVIYKCQHHDYLLKLTYYGTFVTSKLSLLLGLTSSTIA